MTVPPYLVPLVFVYSGDRASFSHLAVGCPRPDTFPPDARWIREDGFRGESLAEEHGFSTKSPGDPEGLAGSVQLEFHTKAGSKAPADCPVWELWNFGSRPELPRAEPFLVRTEERSAGGKQLWRLVKVEGPRAPSV